MLNDLHFIICMARVEFHITEDIAIQRELKQGCIISPILFKVYNFRSLGTELNAEWRQAAEIKSRIEQTK